MSEYESIELNKGRLERRKVQVFDNIEGVNPEWKGLRQIVRVVRSGKRKAKDYHEVAYYITSIQTNAIIYEHRIRAHWAIENSLHYVKGVTMSEDQSKIKAQNAPANMAIMRNISLNRLRKVGYKSIAKAKRMIAHDIQKLTQTIVRE